MACVASPLSPSLSLYVCPLVVVPKHEPFTQDVYVSGACLGTAGTGNRNLAAVRTGHPGVHVSIRRLASGSLVVEEVQ